MIFYSTVHDKIRLEIITISESEGIIIKMPIAFLNKIGGSKMEEKPKSKGYVLRKLFLHVCISAHLLSAAVM